MTTSNIKSAVTNVQIRNNENVVSVCQRHRNRINDELSPDIQEFTSSQEFHDLVRNKLHLSYFLPFDVSTVFHKDYVEVTKGLDKTRIDINEINVNRHLLQKISSTAQAIFSEYGSCCLPPHTHTPPNVSNSGQPNTPTTAAPVAQNTLSTPSSTTAAPLGTTHNVTSAAAQLTSKIELSALNSAKIGELLSIAKKFENPATVAEAKQDFTALTNDIKKLTYFQLGVLPPRGHTDELLSIGEKRFNETDGQTASNKERADALRNLALQQTALLYLKTPEINPDANTAFNMLPETFRNGIFKHLYLIHQDHPRATELRFGENAFLGKNGLETSSQNRYQAIMNFLFAERVTGFDTPDQLQAVFERLKNMLNGVSNDERIALLNQFARMADQFKAISDPKLEYLNPLLNLLELTSKLPPSGTTTSPEWTVAFNTLSPEEKNLIYFHHYLPIASENKTWQAGEIAFNAATTTNEQRRQSIANVILFKLAYLFLEGRNDIAMAAFNRLSDSNKNGIYYHLYLCQPPSHKHNLWKYGEFAFHNSHFNGETLSSTGSQRGQAVLCYLLEKQLDPFHSKIKSLQQQLQSEKLALSDALRQNQAQSQQISQHLSTIHDLKEANKKLALDSEQKLKDQEKLFTEKLKQQSDESLKKESQFQKLIKEQTELFAQEKLKLEQSNLTLKNESQQKQLRIEELERALQAAVQAKLSAAQALTTESERLGLLITAAETKLETATRKFEEEKVKLLANTETAVGEEKKKAQEALLKQAEAFNREKLILEGTITSTIQAKELAEKKLETESEKFKLQVKEAKTQHETATKNFEEDKAILKTATDAAIGEEKKKAKEEAQKQTEAFNEQKRLLEDQINLLKQAAESAKTKLEELARNLLTAEQAKSFAEQTLFSETARLGLLIKSGDKNLEEAKKRFEEEKVKLLANTETAVGEEKKKAQEAAQKLEKAQQKFFREKSTLETQVINPVKAVEEARNSERAANEKLQQVQEKIPQLEKEKENLKKQIEQLNQQLQKKLHNDQEALDEVDVPAAIAVEHVNHQSESVNESGTPLQLVNEEPDFTTFEEDIAILEEANKNSELTSTYSEWGPEGTINFNDPNNFPSFEPTDLFGQFDKERLQEDLAIAQLERNEAKLQVLDLKETVEQQKLKIDDLNRELKKTRKKMETEEFQKIELSLQLEESEQQLKENAIGHVSGRVILINNLTPSLEEAHTIIQEKDKEIANLKKQLELAKISSESQNQKTTATIQNATQPLKNILSSHPPQPEKPTSIYSDPFSLDFPLQNENKTFESPIKLTPTPSDESAKTVSEEPNLSVIEDIEEFVKGLQLSDNSTTSEHTLSQMPNSPISLKQQGSQIDSPNVSPMIREKKPKFNEPANFDLEQPLETRTSAQLEVLGPTLLLERSKNLPVGIENQQNNDSFGDVTSFTSEEIDKMGFSFDDLKITDMASLLGIKDELNNAAAPKRLAKLDSDSQRTIPLSKKQLIEEVENQKQEIKKVREQFESKKAAEQKRFDEIDSNFEILKQLKGELEKTKQSLLIPQDADLDPNQNISSQNLDSSLLSLKGNFSQLLDPTQDEEAITAQAISSLKIPSKSIETQSEAEESTKTVLEEPNLSSIEGVEEFVNGLRLSDNSTTSEHTLSQITNSPTSLKIRSMIHPIDVSPITRSKNLPTYIENPQNNNLFGDIESLTAEEIEHILQPIAELDNTDMETLLGIKEKANTAQLSNEELKKELEKHKKDVEKAREDFEINKAADQKRFAELNNDLASINELRDQLQNAISSRPFLQVDETNITDTTNSSTEIQSETDEFLFEKLLGLNDSSELENVEKQKEKIEAVKKQQEEINSQVKESKKELSSIENSLNDENEKIERDLEALFKELNEANKDLSQAEEMITLTRHDPRKLNTSDDTAPSSAQNPFENLADDILISLYENRDALFNEELFFLLFPHLSYLKEQKRSLNNQDNLNPLISPVEQSKTPVFYSPIKNSATPVKTSGLDNSPISSRLLSPGLPLTDKSFESPIHLSATPSAEETSEHEFNSPISSQKSLETPQSPDFSPIMKVEDNYFEGPGEDQLEQPKEHKTRRQLAFSKEAPANDLSDSIRRQKLNISKAKDEIESLLSEFETEKQTLSECRKLFSAPVDTNDLEKQLKSLRQQLDLIKANQEALNRIDNDTAKHFQSGSTFAKEKKELHANNNLDPTILRTEDYAAKINQLRETFKKLQANIKEFTSQDLQKTNDLLDTDPFAEQNELSFSQLLNLTDDEEQNNSTTVPGKIISSLDKKKKLLNSSQDSDAIFDLDNVDETFVFNPQGNDSLFNISEDEIKEPVTPQSKSPSQNKGMESSNRSNQSSLVQPQSSFFEELNQSMLNYPPVFSNKEMLESFFSPSSNVNGGFESKQEEVEPAQSTSDSFEAFNAPSAFEIAIDNLSPTVSKNPSSKMEDKEKLFQKPQNVSISSLSNLNANVPTPVIELPDQNRLNAFLVNQAILNFPSLDQFEFDVKSKILKIKGYTNALGLPENFSVTGNTFNPEIIANVCTNADRLENFIKSNFTAEMIKIIESQAKESAHKLPDFEAKHPLKEFSKEIRMKFNIIHRYASSPLFSALNSMCATAHKFHELDKNKWKGEIDRFSQFIDQFLSTHSQEIDNLEAYQQDPNQYSREIHTISFAIINDLINTCLRDNPKFPHFALEAFALSLADYCKSETGTTTDTREFIKRIDRFVYILKVAFAYVNPVVKKSN